MCRLWDKEKARRAARKGRVPGDGRELFDDWCPHNPRAAWLAYDLMDATDWQHLPDSGGWFEQDESLIEDITLLARMAGFIREQMRANEELGDIDHA